MSKTMLMILRYDPDLEVWVVNEDSVHHLEGCGDVVELEIITITPIVKAEE